VHLCNLVDSSVLAPGERSTKGTGAVKLKGTIFSISLLAFLVSPACQSTKQSDNLTGIVVVNSPAAGRVKRIVVAEGVHVEQGTPIVEIAVQSESNALATPARDGSEAKAISSYQSADAAIEAARAEVVRHEAEVARLTPLVDSGAASQGQLDGERSLYEQAQRRLTQAQEAKRSAEGALLAARQPNQSQVNLPTPREQMVSAVSSSPGKVAVINVRVGDLVKVGEPLATIRADN
jgi:multidrug efflux pump subunit AcrA (membrane-fusion protein)